MTCAEIKRKEWREEVESLRRSIQTEQDILALKRNAGRLHYILANALDDPKDDDTKGARVFTKHKVIGRGFVKGI